MTIRDFLLIGTPLIGVLSGLLLHWLIRRLAAFPFEERYLKRMLKTHALFDLKPHLIDLDEMIGQSSVFKPALTEESDVSGGFAYDERLPARTALRLAAKNLFDRCFALVALITLAPLLIGISVAIKVTSRGPVVFRQKRKGYDGRIFTIYKFRSMRLHAESRILAGVAQATRNDARVTRVGAFLRRTSLDELPQLWNVLTGSMSLVGPRPYALEHDDLYRAIVSQYMYRYRVKPGMTGWAQVHGLRSNVVWEQPEKRKEELKFDIFYILHRSFWFDVKIVASAVAQL